MLVNFDTVCRCCLRSNNLKSMFFVNKTKTTVAFDEMIQYCCSISVTQNDGLPTQICSNCVTKLKALYKFKKQCIESHAELLKLKKKLSQTVKLEPKFEEFEFDHIDASPKNIIINQLQDTDKKIIFDQEKDLEQLEDDIKTEINDDDQAFNEETGVKGGVCKINDDPGLPEIFEKKEDKKIVGEDIKQCITKKAKCMGSLETKIKKKKTKIKCDACDVFFYSTIKLEEHINWVHYGIKRYHCSICDKDYMNEKLHRAKHENSPFTSTCDKCGKIFTSKERYKYHMESHENIEYKCLCGTTFKVKAYLQSHIRLSHGPKKYICHFCSKAYVAKHPLTNHIRIHTGEKPFECEFCHKKFRINLKRKIHIEMNHSDVRAYQCQQCLKEFKTHKTLTKHMAVHKERRYACRVCEQPFGRCDNRNVHERSVHGISKEVAKTMWPV